MTCELHAKVRLTAAGDHGRTAVISALHDTGLTCSLEFLDSLHPTGLEFVPLAHLTVVEPPEPERFQYHVVVNDQLCEVWWRPVPHAYGRWNHEAYDMHLWVKVVTPDFDYQKRLDQETDAIHLAIHTHATDAMQLSDALFDIRHRLIQLDGMREKPCLAPTAGVTWIKFMRTERVIWSVEIKGYQKPDYKHENGLRHGYSGVIIRNLKPVGEFFGRSIDSALRGAQRLIDKLEAHPLAPLFDTPEKIVGLKVWYRGQPARIGSHLMLDQQAVMIEYDGPEQEMPANSKAGAPMIRVKGFNTITAMDIGDDEHGCWHEQGPASVKEDIHASSINWNRYESRSRWGAP